MYSSDGSGTRWIRDQDTLINEYPNEVGGGALLRCGLGAMDLKRTVSVDDSVAAAAYLREESRGAEQRRIFIRCKWLQSGIDKSCLTGTTEAADPEVTSLQILLL